jgi:anti-sigma regulatory factor (Ser/Thr protein kinase)
MISSQRFVVAEESQVGEARRFIQERVKRCGGSEAFCGKAALIVTELGRNLVRHGGGGEIISREVRSEGLHGLEILGIDRGPGLKNVTECMRDGYSTIGTAGTGLGSLQRMSDRFDIFTEVGKGTCVWSQIFDGRITVKTLDFEFSGVNVALEGETLCGDSWEVLPLPDARLRVLVADGLGHGPFAAEASREAISVLRSHEKAGLAETVDLINRALGKTRGAAAAAVDILPLQQQVTVSGVGNISIRVHGPEFSKSLISDNGTLGVNARKAREYTQPFPAGSLLIMHSDGLTANWNLNDFPGLARRSAGLIAGVLYRDFKRGRDDSTVVVARYRP